MKELMYLILVAVFFVWVGAAAHTEMIAHDLDAMQCQISVSNGLKTQHVYIGKLVGDKLP